MSPLANQDPLAQLNDIIAPTAASPWPPALIYWLLLATLIVSIVGLVYLFKRNQIQRVKQQQALLKLQQLQADNANFIVLNQLIKGVTLSYFPRRKVASLHSQQWFNFLQRYSSEPIFTSEQVFIKRLYQDNDSACSAEDFMQTKKWIKQLPKQIKKHRKEVNKHV
jgi:hypothetical protein